MVALEQALLHRGVPHRERKTFLGGTHRSRPPEETLAHIRPWFSRVGITRLATITGLDVIGIPTVLAIRPNARGLSVDAGKGLTLAAARVSAAMETIERWRAETAPIPSVRGAHADLAADHAIVEADTLPRMANSLFTPRWPIRWTPTWDLLEQEEVLAPTCLVGLHHQDGSAFERGLFQAGSNGLASGNTFLEAILSGLLELIERDAVACRLEGLLRSGLPIPRVRLSTIESPVIGDLLHRIRRAGVLPVVRDCTVDTEVPVYMVDLYDERARNLGIFRGYGAHLDPEVALSRALTEAAQSRLVYISGSRDDTFADDLLRLQRLDRRELYEAAREEAAVPWVPFQRRSSATETFHEDVLSLLDRLRRAGIRRVLVHDLSPTDPSVAVVRTIVPGLEGYRSDHYAPGPRARAFAGSRA